jgi:hypothetical protein
MGDELRQFELLLELECLELLVMGDFELFASEQVGETVDLAILPFMLVCALELVLLVLLLLRLVEDV